MTNANLEHRLPALLTSGRFTAAAVDTFARWIEQAPDEELYRVNPMAFAARHKLTPRDAVDLFVYATHAGIFDFAWGRICPSCHAFVAARQGLRAVSHASRCGLCQVDCDGPLDDGVEVSFTVSSAVRRTRFHGGWSAIQGQPPAALARDAMQMYFAHSHPPELEELLRLGLKAVGLVKRGEAAVVRGTLGGPEKGLVRLVAPAIHAVVRIQVEPGAPSEAEVELVDDHAFPAEVSLAPGAVSLRLRQRTDDPEVVVGLFQADLEAVKISARPAVEFLSGKRLLSTQSFRELFRTETLDPDSSLEIRALAMLFTDLKASTQLYERVGDLKALALVREHFSLLRDVVARNDGAVVKTIGDAVMATFVEPCQAAQAAVEMHRAMTRVRPEELQLKVGLHVGPCVAVDSNARLDFFGQTVNIAARVQGLAEGREVVLTDTVFRSPGVQEILAGAGLPVAREEALLKGIEGKVVVHRGTVGAA